MQAYFAIICCCHMLTNKDLYISQKWFLRINYASLHTATNDPSPSETPTDKNNTNTHIVKKQKKNRAAGNKMLQNKNNREMSHINQQCWLGLWVVKFPEIYSNHSRNFRNLSHVHSTYQNISHFDTIISFMCCKMGQNDLILSATYYCIAVACTAQTPCAIPADS